MGGVAWLTPIGHEAAGPWSYPAPALQIEDQSLETLDPLNASRLRFVSGLALGSWVYSCSSFGKAQPYTLQYSTTYIAARRHCGSLTAAPTTNFTVADVPGARRGGDPSA